MLLHALSQRTIYHRQATSKSTMANVDQYINAATRDNTRKSYQSAIAHFEVQWGGFLPATADSIARYLADYADALAISTLKLRLAAIAQWHMDQGFPDPTKSPIVKKVLKGIQTLHPNQIKQAKPLALKHLEQLDAWFAGRIDIADKTGNQSAHLRLLRDHAIVLLGFWRGFRSDELSRLQIQHLIIQPHEGITLYLPQTKTEHEGITYKVPALRRFCPVHACAIWVQMAGITEGPVFPAINRWGRLGKASMHPTSFILILRKILSDAGLENAGSFSSHSLRRGFATWAASSGWDLKTMMEYIGWKDIRSAMRYIDSSGDPFITLRSTLPNLT
ncbi:TnpS [Cellvibrio sp. BR]|uniref:tyrosine-type recombinase/integrase n=1 Tax=Cellvibrio sp. BR TaxID=1134474 RepID=UPI0002600AC3|nr:tyrosine-type recombinase/integrase [Cellvibrio sp. BR]EIK43192.1 TnpS [Cellvibrio sp. BR]